MLLLETKPHFLKCLFYTLTSTYEKEMLALTDCTDLNTVLMDLTAADRVDESIKHALDVRTAWALNNYHRFFQLYLNAPKMAGYLMDKFVGRIRKAALKSTIKAYVFKLSLVIPWLKWMQVIRVINFTSLQTSLIIFFNFLHFRFIFS